jgi:hypothetical protein
MRDRRAAGRDAGTRTELVTASVQAAMQTPAFWSFPTVMLMSMALGTLLISTKWALQVRSATRLGRAATSLLHERPCGSCAAVQRSEQDA